MKRTFFLIPGFKMQIKDKPFSWLVRFLEKKGFRVAKVPVRWNNRTLSRSTKEFIEFFNKNKGEKNYILGFSYGSVITLLSANTIKPEKIFLCSLSSDFKEDRKAMTPSMREYIGKRRFADTNTRSGRDIARKLQIPVVIFYGGKEGKLYPQLKIRCEETARMAKHSKLVMVKDSPHQINFPAYMEAIKKEIN